MLIIIIIKYWFRCYDDGFKVVEIYGQFVIDELIYIENRSVNNLARTLVEV